MIGSGPAGEKGAAQAAYFGKRVALVEKETVMGGAAANTGTIASKTLREIALTFHNKVPGIETRIVRDPIRAEEFLRRENPVKLAEQNRVLENLKRHKVDLFRGFASFLEPHVVSVRAGHGVAVNIHGDIILIATGSSPYRPALFPFDDSRVYDSNTILGLHKLPKTMLIAGGGVVGCEYACMFAALGVLVTMAVDREGLIPFLDGEVAHLLQKKMKAMGITFFLKDPVQTVETGETLQVRLKSGATLQVHTILVSQGRIGNTNNLGLEKVGIPVTERGIIEVNEKYQTKVPHIYAAGDVIGFPSLAAASMEQARVAMVHAFDLKYKTRLSHILPYGIYTIPECAMVGETEESLCNKKIPFIVGKTSYGNNARGQMMGEKEGFLKLLFREDDMKLLGVHIIGAQASEVIHTGLTALQTNANVDLFL